MKEIINFFYEWGNIFQQTYILVLSAKTSLYGSLTLLGAGHIIEKSCYRSFKGGATVSTGIVEAVAACRGSYRPRKTGRINIIADNYDYALAA